jgi:hypothetical protein
LKVDITHEYGTKRGLSPETLKASELKCLFPSAEKGSTRLRMLVEIGAEGVGPDVVPAS